MDDDVIEALADALAGVIQYIPPNASLAFRTFYDCVVNVAIAIHNEEPTYDLRYFYQRAGYPEPYPIHEM